MFFECKDYCENDKKNLQLDVFNYINVHILDILPIYAS